MKAKFAAGEAALGCSVMIPSPQTRCCLLPMLGACAGQGGEEKISGLVKK